MGPGVGTQVDALGPRDDGEITLTQGGSDCDDGGPGREEVGGTVVVSWNGVMNRSRAVAV